MHSLNIVHRDIEPTNVIYNKQTGKLTLVGFSLSMQLNSLNEKMHLSWGTILYMAPERTNKKEYDYSVDWYAYGKTLLILFGGTVEMKKTDIGNEQNYRFVNDYNNLNGSQQDLISHCINNRKEKRIRTLEQIKKHNYFKGLKWDEINTEPNTVELSSLFR